jgi:hypothetical protein
MILPALLVLAASADAAPILKGVTWTASSSAPATESESFDVARLGDQKQSTSWIEGDTGSGLGSWAQAAFAAESNVTGFTIWGGYFYNNEYWNRYNRPKTVQLTFADGSTQDFSLKDSFEPQTFALPAGKKTTTVKVTVKAIYAGNTFNDTAISEIQFHDGAPTRGVPVKEIKASSTFPADGDGDYNTGNLQDGALDSMWCEGNKAGDGVAEWVEFVLPTPQNVGALVLHNGNAYSLPYFMKSNRGIDATLTFSDGTTQVVKLKDAPSEQRVAFPPRATSSVKVSFTSVKKGTEFNDLCVSEAWLEP